MNKVIVDTGREQMPPPPAAPISQANKDMLLKWIKEGAKETKCDVVINSENPNLLLLSNQSLIIIA